MMWWPYFRSRVVDVIVELTLLPTLQLCFEKLLAVHIFDQPEVFLPFRVELSSTRQFWDVGWDELLLTARVSLSLLVAVTY